MQLDWLDHFQHIVIPAWQAYIRAEERLSAAMRADDEAAIQNARYDALREGGAAAFYLHHFAEVVHRAQPHWISPDATKADIWSTVEESCTMLRTDNPVRDVSLLGDVADALKHAVLNRRLEDRQVAAAEAVVVTGDGFGVLAFGEGKFGGEQVLILARDRTRALSSILQNVVDAWRRTVGLDLPDIGQG